jgi:hypothetical protein
MRPTTSSPGGSVSSILRVHSGRGSLFKIVCYLLAVALLVVPQSGMALIRFTANAAVKSHSKIIHRSGRSHAGRFYAKTRRGPLARIAANTGVRAGIQSSQTAQAIAQTRGPAPRPAPRAPTFTGPSFSGKVQDPTGAIIPGAHIDLRRSNGTVIVSALTDSAGQFHIAQPAPGEYQLAVAREGFQPFLQSLRIDRSPPPALTLTLNLASVDTTVVVNASDSVELANPEHNQDATTVSADDMKSLPVFDDDIVATMSALLDSGVSGEGGPTLVVDGVEMKTVGVANSAIERVTINQDPYSAQYGKPGKGQIEITTKSATDKFHGSFTFVFRDAALNASNYFSSTKPPEQRRIYDGYLTGPVKPLHNTAFLFSFERQEDDIDNQVNAETLGPAPAYAPTQLLQNVPAPVRSTWLTMKVNRQLSANHSAYVLYRFYDGTKTNQNVGGQTLASAGSVETSLDMDITFHDDLAIGATKFNQFNLLFERNVDRVTSNLEMPSIVVEGAFTGGGAQADSVNTEYNPNFSDIFSIVHKTQQFKFGVQLPNMGRRALDDNSNRLGTYTFTSLAAYRANTPATYTVQQGQSRFITSYLQPGAFFQDQIQATPSLTITPGVRYDWQNAFPGTMDALQPRLSLAYVADKKHALVVRVGSGVYVRRVGFDVVQRLARYQYAAERSLLVTNNLCYPNISACNPLAAQPPSIFNYQPNLKSPVQAYFGLTVERQLTKQATLSIGYSGFRGWHAARTIDVNAPLPPFTSTVRPNPNYSQILQLNSGGYQKTDGLNVNLRGRIGKFYSGFLQYTLQHADADTLWSEFNPENQYNPNADWSRSDTDQRQRLALFGTFFPDMPLTLGLGFYENTPLPYSITTGTDSYDPGLFNARPAGVPRNSLNGGNYQDVQLRLGYNYKIHPHQKEPGPTINASIASFNTLNRANFTSYNGVITAPNFMQPITASSPRRLQLSLTYSF